MHFCGRDLHLQLQHISGCTKRRALPQPDLLEVEVRSCPIRVDREDLCFDRLGGWFSYLLADGRLVDLLNEDTSRNRGPLGTHLRQLVSLVVVILEYVCQLQSVKGALQFPDLLEVR